jgi:hypothetical protein
LRQVDDFSIACTHIDIYDHVCDLLDEELAVPITHHGILTQFNGTDVVQACTHITISVEQYLDTVFESHGWTNLIPLSLPMCPDNDFVKTLDSTIPLDLDVCSASDKQHFRYRGAIGELIWLVITTHPELVFPVVELSEFSVAPAMILYDVILAIYLSVTKYHGVTYTKVIFVEHLSYTMLSSQSAFPSDAPNDHQLTDLYDLLYGYADSDWAMDI